MCHQLVAPAKMLVNTLEKPRILTGLNRVCAVLRRTKSSNVQLINPSAAMYPVKGECYDNKSVKVTIEANKEYSWCACGLSGRQPWCDGSHRSEGVTTVRPVKFTVTKAGEYSLCNCKATGNRPLCDGTHKQLPKPHRYKDLPQLNRYDQSPVYVGVSHKLGYRPKQGRWHF